MPLSCTLKIVEMVNFVLMHILPQLNKSYLAPNVNSAEAEKPWIPQRGCRCFPQLLGQPVQEGG